MRDFSLNECLMKTYKTFETERLFLRPTTENDAELILALFNTPKWLRFIGDRNVQTLEEAVEYIRSKMTPHLEKHGYGNYAVTRKTDGTKMGTCGLYNREGIDGVDIGFALLPEFEGQGFAHEAAQKVMLAAFASFGLEHLAGYCAKDNAASQKLLEKLGFTRNGLKRLPTNEEELLAYTITLRQE